MSENGARDDGRRDDGRRDDGAGDVDEEQADHESLPDPAEADPPLVAAVGWVHDSVYYLVALVLVAVAAVVLVHTVAAGLASDEPFAGRVTEAVSGLLFVIIILELLRTVLAHFQDPVLHLKPFLIIGIISVVRHLLTVGGKGSLEDEPAGLFARSDVELGVNALVVLVLVLGLVLLRRTEDDDGDRRPPRRKTAVGASRQERSAARERTPAGAE